MELNKKLRRKNTNTSLPLRNVERRHRNITEVNKKYKEFLTQGCGG